MSLALAGDYVIQTTEMEWKLYEIGENVMDDLYSPLAPTKMIGALIAEYNKQDDILHIQSTTPSTAGISQELLDILARCMVQTILNIKTTATTTTLQLFDLYSKPMACNSLHTLFPKHTNDEFIELVNQHGHTLAAIPRTLAHQYNLLHRGIGVVVHYSQQNNPKNDAPSHSCYVHQRTHTKRIFPSLYDMWCGGISLADELPLVTAQRELEEELGLAGSPQQFTFLFQTTVCTAYNRCVVHVFSYAYNEGEVIQWQPEEVRWGSFCDMRSVELSAEMCTARMVEQLTWPGNKQPERWEERRRALSLSMADTNDEPWATWDYVPDGLLVWEAWLEWRRTNSLPLLESSSVTK